MSSGGVGPLPFRFNDILSSSYYAISIIAVLLAMAGFAFSLKWRIDDLEHREQEHPTRHELATVAIKVDDNLKGLEKHVNDLDQYGTRALADRTTLLEQENHIQGERIQDLVRRINTLQESLNKLASDIPVVVDRQNNNSNAIRELQPRIWSSGGERGPAAPINQPQHPQ